MKQIGLKVAPSQAHVGKWAAVALLTLCLVCGVSASLNFQTASQFNGSNNRSDITCIGGACNWVQTVALNNYAHSDCNSGMIINSVATPSTYWAATLVPGYSPGYVWCNLVTYDTSRTQLWATSGISNSTKARYEVKTSGAEQFLYRDGVFVANSSRGLVANPAFYGVQCGNYAWCYSDLIVDDWVQGSSDDKYVLGIPDGNNYYIVNDIINPDAIGIADIATDTTRTAAMRVTWSRGAAGIPADPDLGNATLDLVSVDTGVSYGTIYTGNYSYFGQADIPLTPMVTNKAPSGGYALRLRGSTIESNQIQYRSRGAVITFDRESYSQQDEARITYSILGQYWDTSTYTYTAKIYRANDWTVIDSASISSSTGSFTHTFTSDDTEGEYYVFIVVTPNAGGSIILMGSDYATVSAYTIFTGYVNDAETATVLSGANVSITQYGVTSNSVTTASGNYVAPGFLRGAPVTFNVTKSGYDQYLAIMSPLASKTVSLNFTLSKTSPFTLGKGIGGVVRDGTFAGSTITNGFGRPLSGAVVYVRNTSTGEYYNKTTNNAGWYLCDEGASCFLTTQRLYDVWGNLFGYANSSTYQVVAP